MHGCTCNLPLTHAGLLLQVLPLALNHVLSHGWSFIENLPTPFTGEIFIWGVLIEVVLHCVVLSVGLEVANFANPQGFAVGHLLPDHKLVGEHT